MRALEFAHANEMIHQNICPQIQVEATRRALRVSQASHAASAGGGGRRRVAIWWREGPCLVEGCPNPDTSGGQWAFIPEEYCEQHGLDLGVACTCKRAGCLRACERKEPKRAPGRKRKRTHTAVSPPTTASCIEDLLPRPPTILSIDEVWADRCATRSHCTPRPRPPRPLLTVAARCGTCGGGRCVDIEEMSEIARGNVLPQQRSHSLQYAVHGKWQRAPNDTNGTHGCWYIDVLQPARRHLRRGRGERENGRV